MMHASRDLVRQSVPTFFDLLNPHSSRRPRRSRSRGLALQPDDHHLIIIITHQKRTHSGDQGGREGTYPCPLLAYCTCTAAWGPLQLACGEGIHPRFFPIHPSVPGTCIRILLLHRVVWPTRLLTPTIVCHVPSLPNQAG